MKKLLLILVLPLVLFFGCSKTIESKLEDKLEDMGYKSVKYTGEVIQMRITNKEDQYRELATAQFWELQELDISKYEGKSIDYYIFYVKNHPLAEKSNKSGYTLLWVGVYNEKFIGGVSEPFLSYDLEGRGYSLDGKTLDEVTGIPFDKWKENWIENYK